MFPIAENLNVAKFKILSVNIPVSWDPVSEGNNKINFVEASSNSTIRTATLATGRYHVGTIEGAVAAALNAVGTQTYTVTYDERNRSLSVSAPGLFQILGGVSGSSAFKILGIHRYANSQFATTQNLPNTIDLTNNNPVLLCSNSLSSLNVKYLGHQSLNCLTSIDIGNPVNSVVNWENSGGSYLDCNQTLQMLDFSLVDSASGSTIDMRGQNFSVRIGIFDDENDVPV
jgi:hypothetical protein